MKNKSKIFIWLLIFLGISFFYLFFHNNSYEVLYEIRLPKLLIAIITGSGLGLVGAVFQAIFKNPLADPYLLGVSSGASLGTVIGFYFRLNSITYIGNFSIIFLSFITGLITIFLVFTLSNFYKTFNMLSLILSGVILNVLFYALSYLIIASDYFRLHNVILWLWGKISIYDFSTILLSLILICIYYFYLLYNYKILNLFLIGPEMVESKGFNYKKNTLILLVSSTIITSLIVSLSGIIGFVGLIVPHISRMIIGYDYKRVLILTPIIGAIFIILADIISTYLFYPQILPIGIISSIIGAPVFFIILRRNKN